MGLLIIGTELSLILLPAIGLPLDSEGDDVLSLAETRSPKRCFPFSEEKGRGNGGGDWEERREGAAIGCKVNKNKDLVYICFWT